MDIPIPICFFCKSCVESFLYPIDKVRDLIQALKVGGYCHFLGTAKIKEVEFRRVIIYAAFYYDSSSQNKKKENRKKERKKIQKPFTQPLVSIQRHLFYIFLLLPLKFPKLVDDIRFFLHFVFKTQPIVRYFYTELSSSSPEFKPFGNNYKKKILITYTQTIASHYKLLIINIIIIR